MARKKKKKQVTKKHLPENIVEISVSGYKSIATEQTLELGPLTLLAGANSSGKSSMMQSLLLLKQTLDEESDPGAIQLLGSHIKFFSVDQLFCNAPPRQSPKSLVFKQKLGNGDTLSTEYVRYTKERRKGLQVKRMTYFDANEKEAITFKPGMTHKKIVSILPKWTNHFKKQFEKKIKGRAEWHIYQSRCFLGANLRPKSKKKATSFRPIMSPSIYFVEEIGKIIHLPPLRGAPERVYPVTSAGPNYPGTFEKYTASIIADWRATDNRQKLNGLNRDLKDLGLTWKVSAEQIDDTRVKLRVGRIPDPGKNGAKDLIDVADIGFGVSQVLPVITALHAATDGQLVYLEQPEIHLHPKAQYKLANVLAKAVARGVRMVVETHSALLLLGIQTLTAQGEIEPSNVKFHWFERNAKGETKITSADLDKTGAFGDWPEDFANVELEANKIYLDVSG